MSDGPTRDDLVCTAILLLWIAFMLNVPKIATFLSGIFQ